MICSLCGKQAATQRHHKFPQFKRHRRQYGKLIDAEFNLEPACSCCNSSHANIPDWAHWNEADFRAAAEERGYVLPPPLRSFKGNQNFFYKKS